MENYKKDYSFQVVFQNKQLTHISDNFFILYDCYNSLDDFLHIHKDITELFDTKLQNRKYFPKSFFTPHWYIKLSDTKNFRASRVILEFKEKLYHYEITSIQSFSNNQEYTVLFKDISKQVQTEHKFANYYTNQKKNISKLNNLAKHKDKLSLMGEMMENIAHQWKQPLSNITFIASSIQLKKELEDLSDEDFTESLENILNNIDYMSQTIQDFRTFLNEEKQKKVFNINHVIDKTALIIEGSMNKASIKFHLDFKRDCYAKGFENELVQAIINILNNAIDALKVQDPYERNISLTLTQDEQFNIITIEDNAGGIPDAIKDKIFEHYFTTKGDRGTGIGLFITKEIIEKHFHGIMNVSNTKRGAKFELKIPLYKFDQIEEEIYKE